MITHGRQCADRTIPEKCGMLNRTDDLAAAKLAEKLILFGEEQRSISSQKARSTVTIVLGDQTRWLAWPFGLSVQERPKDINDA
ncbi:hypothetical protein R1flu_002020 [Riccia fluitans]|uniref:Uncharacterized protein n=1 Tax=Riccia fluitans TaxID=41844 RepID=A0ABD1Y5F4_9MARC